MNFQYKTPRRAGAAATTWLDDDVPDAAVAAITGVEIPKREDIPFFGPKDRVTIKPALKLRPSEGPGLEGRWMIEDLLTADEALVLGRSERRVRDSTNCVESDRDGAAAAFAAYLADKRTRILASAKPEDTPLSAIILTYLDLLDSGAHNLKPATARSYASKLVPIGEWWGAKPAKAVTEKFCALYADWRRGHSVGKRTKRLISETEIGHEIGALRTAINHFQKATPLNHAFRYHLPDRDTPDVAWLRRDEVAAYLLACRGRIAAVTRDADGRVVNRRWLLARELDPSLAGPEGDRLARRPPDEIERRRSEIRRVMIALNTASRGTVVADTAYHRTDGRPYASPVEGMLRRRPPGKAIERRKRKPPIPLALKLRRFLNWWARSDLERFGFLPTHVVNKPDGDPLVGDRNLRIRVFEDAGLDTPPTANVLRHTCAMWMKIEKVPSQTAADVLGTSVEVLEMHYGTWDELSMEEAVRALSLGKVQKELARRRKLEGAIVG